MFERPWSQICAIACTSLIAACAMSPGADTADGGSIESPPDTAEPGAPPDPQDSRCIETANEVTCSYMTVPFQALLLTRNVHYQTPVGKPPPGGWPVVFYFQGAFVASENAFHATRDALAGQFHLVRTIAALLDDGYAVIAPDALVNLAWQTNIPPYSLLWSATSDNALLNSIFAGIRAGRLGPLDASRMYAMGISSGGYMTSRMAVSYPGMFRALAIHSASYATCGVGCLLPGHLPDDHPPTLFLHGAQDFIVPVTQMQQYRDQLAHEGHIVTTILDPAARHAWIEGAVPAVAQWFDANP